MKLNRLLLLALTLFILLLPIIGYYINKRNRQKAALTIFQYQLGSYQLDLYRTKLNHYVNDSTLYKNLQITFSCDSTFHMNMKVPFLHDSVGKWNVSGTGPEDWNWLYYKNWGYSKYEVSTGNQFTTPWTPDSIFYLNGPTPQNDAYPLPAIYFIKIKKLTGKKS